MGSTAWVYLFDCVDLRGLRVPHLQAYRWIDDSRDDYTQERLEALDDAFKLFRSALRVPPGGHSPANKQQGFHDNVPSMPAMVSKPIPRLFCLIFFFCWSNLFVWMLL